jgi:hypothetical protein
VWLKLWARTTCLEGTGEPGSHTAPAQACGAGMNIPGAGKSGQELDWDLAGRPLLSAGPPEAVHFRAGPSLFTGAMDPGKPAWWAL